jgi:hypothetical protein
LPDDQSTSTADDSAPLRILIGADTFVPDVNGAANFTSRLAAGMVGRQRLARSMGDSSKSTMGRNSLCTACIRGGGFRMTGFGSSFRGAAKPTRLVFSTR